VKRIMTLTLQLRTLIRLAALPAMVSLTMVSALEGQSAADFTRADVEFMQGMIHHHAQAIVMSTMASSHGASEKVLLLCKKIIISQRDEIGFMQGWLKDRNQPAPDLRDPHFGEMPGMPGMKMTMPGMLSDEQLKVLDLAKGADFDRLFLTGMIQHHKGALTMVADLNAAPGGGQQPDLFRFASDVLADQTAEIGRMQQMLNLPPGSKKP
jgi:uncharacterized protein (DUF305 family)